MTLREEIDQARIKDLVDNHNDFEFPEFVRCVRKTLGISRKHMGTCIGSTEMQLYYLESGALKRIPEMSLLCGIAAFLGISKLLLIQKARDHYAGDTK